MRRIACALVLCALSLLAGSVQAEEIFGLTNTGKLVRFDSANPGTITGTVTISGLQASESLVGIDFRPETGELFGVGSTSRVYKINVTSGVATVVGTTPFTPALNGQNFGVDFNPTVDRIRLVSNLAQNLRLNADTGAVANTDTALAYSTGDALAGTAPNVVSIAYTNNVTTNNGA
ncbi:MAG TPA: DUF4394 domain-containing protein, partial [Planctomycetota bacterium]|nr:DUF4394 domain-containing protein [Planctomycetota bacterium]